MERLPSQSCLSIVCGFLLQDGASLLTIRMGPGQAMTSAVRMDSGPVIKQKAYQSMYEHMGMGDHVAVTNIIVTKVGLGHQ
jgi:hypothetical protein